jgi:hypothetical protein
LANVELPATPTEPTSPSVQTQGKQQFTAAVTVKATVADFVKLPEVPVTVTVTGPPVVAVLVAVRVSVLEPVVGFGLNPALTPLGRPEADKLTLPLKPFCGVTLIVLVPLVPCVILKLLGDAESVKALTVTETVVLLVRPQHVPVTVTGNVPVVAALVAVRVSVLEPVVGFGLNPALTPPGRPEAVKLTLPLKPFCGVTVIVLVAFAPWTTLTLLGDAESVKFCGALTISESVVLLLKPLAAPVTVTGNVPVVAELVAVRVSVLEPVVGFGLNPALTPLGRLEVDKVTPLLKPFCGVTVIVLVPLAPCVMLKLLGDAERL